MSQSQQPFPERKRAATVSICVSSDFRTGQTPGMTRRSLAALLVVLTLLAIGVGFGSVSCGGDSAEAPQEEMGAPEATEVMSDTTQAPETTTAKPSATEAAASGATSQAEPSAKGTATGVWTGKTRQTSTDGGAARFEVQIKLDSGEEVWADATDIGTDLFYNELIPDSTRVQCEETSDGWRFTGKAQ
jgi:hypothetical protein